MSSASNAANRHGVNHASARGVEIRSAPASQESMPGQFVRVGVEPK
jgi:hypothetical protein